DVDAGGGEFTRRPHAHLVGRIDLALAAFDHRQRRDDEGHAGGNELVEFVREYFRAARRGGVGDAGAVAGDVAAGRWLPIDHSCPVLLATARNTVTGFAADDTRNLARCDRASPATDVHAIGERYGERRVRAVAQGIGCRRRVLVVGRRAGRILSARGRRRSGQ